MVREGGREEKERERNSNVREKHLLTPFPRALTGD